MPESCKAGLPSFPLPWSLAYLPDFWWKERKRTRTKVKSNQNLNFTSMSSNEKNRQRIRDSTMFYHFHFSCVRKNTMYLNQKMECPECPYVTTVREFNAHLKAKHILLHWYLEQLESGNWVICQVGLHDRMDQWYIWHCHNFGAYLKERWW